MSRLWLILFVSFVLFTSFAKSETVYTTLVNFIPSEKTENFLILSGSDGRVYKLPRSKENKKLLEELKGAVVVLDVNGDDLVGARLASSLEPGVQETDVNLFAFNANRVFTPSNLPSYEAAAEIFKNLINDGDRNRSQCFKRAHIWVYDMWAKQGIFSQKVFMFYTQRYIQVEDFKWWFHVAPVVRAAGIDYVMDGTFMTKPKTLKEWQDFFMHTDKIHCPEITNYTEYSEHQWSRLCYLMKVPMYYFSPLDVENRDLHGKAKTHWVLPELQDARKAFKDFEEHYEGLTTGKPVQTF